jgi:hypothetical protein
MKVHQTLEWLNLLSLGTKGLKPRQQSVCNQGSVTGGGWRGQHLNSQQHSLTTLIRHFVLWNKRALSSAVLYSVYWPPHLRPPPCSMPAVPVRQVILPAAVPARPAGIQCCQVLISIHGHIRQKPRPFSKLSRPPIKKFAAAWYFKAQQQ